MTDVPDWVHDKIFPRKSRAAILLTLALFRHGSARVISGERRVYLQESRDRLARLSLCSKRALDAGITELIEADFLTVHPSGHSRKSDGFSLPVAQRWGATSAPLGVQLLHPNQIQWGATSAPLGSVVVDLDPPDQDLHDLEIPTTTTDAGARTREDADWIIFQLEELRFPDYEQVEIFDRFGPVVLRDAIHRVWKHLPEPLAGETDCWANRIAAGKLRNPRGFLIKLAKELAAETPLTSRLERR